MRRMKMRMRRMRRRRMRMIVKKINNLKNVRPILF